MTDYTIFVTYLLKPTVVAGGYSPAVHCNYIHSVQVSTETLAIEEVRIIFPEINDFKFLNSNLTAVNGTGYSANYIYVLIQTGITTTNLVPDPALWKIVDVSGQISGHTAGTPLTPAQLTSLVFKVALNNYNTLPFYSLNTDVNGLNYPSNLTSADDQLCFGDETFFLGNVSAEIHADVYTTNLSVILPLGEFNSSNNSTWDGLSVYMTEIGIFDDNNNLVAIGKFNDPIEKNGQISRTVLFAIDF
jgi:hypothetical protein